MRRIVYILIFASILLTLNACSPTKGSIIIKENISGTGCEIEFSEWSGENKCELSLNKKDELQVVVSCTSGDIALSIRGKNGSEAYTGNGLDTITFTVKVPEADQYVIAINGRNATGSIEINNLSR
jgi:hypothetical protein